MSDYTESTDIGDAGHPSEAGRCIYAHTILDTNYNFLPSLLKGHVSVGSERNSQA